MSGLVMRVTRWVAVFAVALLLKSWGDLFALGLKDVDIELDPYYSDVALTIPFSEGATESDVEQGEMTTYRGMLTRALLPRFLVLEASLNPLPITGVAVRKRARHFYSQAQATPSLNLVDAVTAGFEEPYAFSIFLGKVIDFNPGEQSLRRKKKGYVGYLASAGNYHILESRMIPDNWLEAEAKIKGDQETARRRMSWSFRGGGKFHSNREIADTYYLGIRRNRIDFEKSRYSFLLSSGIEYRVDFDKRSLSPISHYLMLDKNFPLYNGKMTFSIGLGYLWQGLDKYSGALAQGRQRSKSQVLIRPNLKF